MGSTSTPYGVNVPTQKHHQRSFAVEAHVARQEELGAHPRTSNVHVSQDVFKTRQEPVVLELPGWKSSLPMLIWQGYQEPLAPACLDLREVTPESGSDLVGIEHVALRGEDVALRLLAACFCCRQWIHHRSSGAGSVGQSAERREKRRISASFDGFTELLVVNRVADSVDGIDGPFEQRCPDRIVVRTMGGKLGRDASCPVSRARIISHRCLPGAVPLSVVLAGSPWEIPHGDPSPHYERCEAGSTSSGIGQRYGLPSVFT